MRWPRLSLSRPDGSKQARHSSSSSSETPSGDKVTSPSEPHDPVLARLFSDAASFNRILNPPDVAEDSRAAHDSMNGFSQLVAPDLDDDERVASEKLAQLSVSNWGAGPTTLAPDVGPDESDESASDAEHDKVVPGGTAQAAGEPEFEDKLAPGEVLDLLQQEFGALAPPGEEKLLVETDATIFQDVVILVCP
jgi:sterol 3beta-glucosyltransferase